MACLLAMINPKIVQVEETMDASMCLGLSPGYTWNDEHMSWELVAIESNFTSKDYVDGGRPLVF